MKRFNLKIRLHSFSLTASPECKFPLIKENATGRPGNKNTHSTGEKNKELSFAFRLMNNTSTCASNHGFKIISVFLQARQQGNKFMNALEGMPSVMAATAQQNNCPYPGLA